MTPTTPNLEIDLGGLKMKNPVTVASGTFGYGQEYGQYYPLSKLGAVTTKSVSMEPRPGNPPPRIVETPAGMLNAIGLQNVGIDAYLAAKAGYLRDCGATVIANIVGKTADEYAELARRLEEAGAADAIEANLSCPNVYDAANAKGAVLVAQDPDAVAAFTSTIRSATKLPLYIKLSPNVTDIRPPCLAAQEAGADGVSLINTLMGMAINTRTRHPKLARITGGLSGPAIRPVAIKMVWDAARVLDIPIIGMGGIATAEDAVEFMLAGATAVAVGSMNFRQPDAPIRIIEGIETHLREHQIGAVTELVGAVKT